MSGKPAEKNLLEEMLSRIVHRGPDHRGTYLRESIALGNQRLKIIDLEGGNQPIFNEDESVVVVYNGEIYNFQELRKELVAKGHQFRTQSDTEILVHLYEEEGIGFVSRLNGIFAFALYDIRRGELFVARDRFGIKPLFYMKTAEGIFFGSEINALKVVPSFSKELDYGALGIYLAQHYIPQPWSAFKAVRRLEAGHYLHITADNQLEDHTYFDVNFTDKLSISREEAKEELITRLRTAVSRQLVADVPVGIFLSGGIDSGAILAMAKESALPIETFTLSFKDKDCDENVESSRWADCFQTKHHAVTMTETDLLEGLEGRFDGFGEPLGPWINYGQTFIAREAYRQGFKVMLNGAGGDELFCGYPTLNAAILSRYYRKIPAVVRDGLIARVTNRLPAGSGNFPLSFKLKSFVNAVSDTDFETFFNFKTVISPKDYGRLLTADTQRRLEGIDPTCNFQRYAEKVKDWALIDALQYLDMKNFLEGSILTAGDSAAMATSVEERVPFLDNDVVNFACSLPVELKFNLFSLKALLRESLQQYLVGRGAGKLLERYRKRGYWLPANYWLKRDPMRKYVQERLSPENLKKLNFFQPEAVQQLLHEHDSQRHNNDRKLQCILGLVHFLEKQQ